MKENETRTGFTQRVFKHLSGAAVFFVVWLILCFFINLFRSADETDKSRFSRSGMSLYTDYGTGLQYIKGGWCGTMLPRKDKDGNHMRVEVSR